MRKLSTWLVVALAGGALGAGCGSSSSSTSSSQSTPTAAATSSSGATAGGGPANKPSALQSAAACRQAIQAQRTIPAAAKAKLDAICEKAAKGDTTALHRAAQEVCVEVVNASVPPGASRQRALAYCNVK